MFRLRKKQPKPKEYTISFEKEYIPIDWGEYAEVTDASILSALESVRKQFGFEIVNVDIRKVFNRSSIRIKCMPEDRQKIFMAFCTKMQGHITEVSFG